MTQEQTTNMTNNEMIFAMGLPAAGKSTTAHRRFDGTHNFIDPDQIKETHPEYDPRNAFAVHDWSTEIAEQMFTDALEAGEGRFVIDGTGTNAEKMVYNMKRARVAGFTVKLFYVKCTLETSLRRAAKRTRQVPESVIIEKAALISTSFEIVQDYADQVEVVDNDQDR
jgi:predicted kinase